VLFALLYADNSDIVGTYSSRDEALAELASFVAEHPELHDDVGLRPYHDGRPAGDFRSAQRPDRAAAAGRCLRDSPDLSATRLGPPRHRGARADHCDHVHWGMDA
jgi:hypothetical protein